MATNTDNEMVEEQDEEITQECSRLLEELKLRQESVSQAAKAVNTQDPHTDISEQKVRLLTAQIALLQEKKVSVEPEHIDPVAIRDKLVTLNTQLTEVLLRVKQERSDLEEEVKQQQQLKDELLQIKAALMARLRDAEAAAAESPVDQQDIDKQQQDEIAQRTAFYTDTLKEFLSFVNKHYPAPAAATVGDVYDVNDTVASSQSDVMSLKDMLELLMNKTIDSPNDPYVELDPSVHWAPYVELLQRSGITVRHPNNNNLIKVTPFHL